jgi:hypothetical protein
MEYARWRGRLENFINLGRVQAAPDLGFVLPAFDVFWINTKITEKPLVV